MTTRRLLLLGLFLVSLYFVFLVLKPLIPGIAWAVVLVTAFYPLYTRLVRLLRGREWGASILMSAFVAAAIVLPLFLAAVRIVRSIESVYRFFERRVSSGVGPDPVQQIYAVLDQVRAFLGQFIDVSKIDLQASLVKGLQDIGTSLSAKTGALIGNALTTVLTVFVMLVTMAFLFKESRRIVDYVRRNLPLADDDRTRVITEFQSVIEAVFYGVMLTALIQATIGGIGCALAGLPNPFTLGAAMFFCALLPIGGTSLVWLPAGIYLIMKDHVGAGVFLLLWGGLVVSMIDNVLKPIFIKGRTRMHLLLVSFGIFGGLSAFGFIGLFVGPLVIALFLFLLDVVRREGMAPTAHDSSPTATE
ncbi:MAG: AI-2E family transporter [bacterium]